MKVFQFLFIGTLLWCCSHMLLSCLCVHLTPVSFVTRSLPVQTGLWVGPPEPEGGGPERGVGQQWREDSGHPQGQEQNQLAAALPSQVCMNMSGAVFDQQGSEHFIRLVVMYCVCSLSLSYDNLRIIDLCWVKDFLPSVSFVTRTALMSPKRAPTARPGRDRFTAESYTVLGEHTHYYSEHTETHSQCGYLT